MDAGVATSGDISIRDAGTGTISSDNNNNSDNKI